MPWEKPAHLKKSEPFSMRTTPKFKADLRALSERMEISQTQVLEYLVRSAAKRRGLNQ